MGSRMRVTLRSMVAVDASEARLLTSLSPLSCRPWWRWRASSGRDVMCEEAGERMLRGMGRVAVLINCARKGHLEGHLEMNFQVLHALGWFCNLMSCTSNVFHALSSKSLFDEFSSASNDLHLQEPVFASWT